MTEPLASPPYWLFFAAQVISSTGSAVAPIALAFAILEIGGADRGSHWCWAPGCRCRSSSWPPRSPGRLRPSGSHPPDPHPATYPPPRTRPRIREHRTRRIHPHPDRLGHRRHHRRPARHPDGHDRMRGHHGHGQPHPTGPARRTSTRSSCLLTRWHCCGDALPRGVRAHWCFQPDDLVTAVMPPRRQAPRKPPTRLWPEAGVGQPGLRRA
jgi:hypothetical protein